MCNERYVTVCWKRSISLYGDLDTYNISAKLVLFIHNNSWHVYVQVYVRARDAVLNTRDVRVIKRPAKINDTEIAFSRKTGFAMQSTYKEM